LVFIEHWLQFVNFFGFRLNQTTIELRAEKGVLTAAFQKIEERSRQRSPEDVQHHAMPAKTDGGEIKKS